MVTYKNRTRNVLSCLIGAAVFTVATGPLNHADADLNIVGSTHGQNYQGVASPPGTPPANPPGAAYAVPLALCDPNPPSLPERYQNAAGVLDRQDSSIVMPANTAILWRCQLNGVPNFTFRYTGGFSAKAYAAIKQPFGGDGSKFTTIVPTGCTAVANNPQTDPGTGRQYNSFQNCATTEDAFANFATSDTKGTNFAANMCDQTGACASPILDTNVQSFPITATPFAMIVGNGVQKCNPADNSANGKISLTRSQVEAIFSGQVTNWNQLGYCVFAATDTNGDGFRDLDPIGTTFNAGVDQNIMTCHRPITAGTRIIFNATQMLNAPELNFGSTGAGVPYNPFTTAGGVYNWLAPTVADGLTCVQGRTTPAPASPPNPNAIAYNRADEAGNSADFGAGNVGRMNGGYPVKLEDVLPSSYVKPGNIIHPTSDERATSQKDFRCGRYTFWADWVGIQRTSPQDANQLLWNQYVALIAGHLEDSPAGYFWAKNLKQPGQPQNSEMFVSKGVTKGPTQWNTGFPLACR